MKQETNYEVFSRETKQNSNVIDTQTIKQIITSHTEFNQDNIQKQYSQLDFQLLGTQIDLDKISSQWVQKNFKGATGKSPFTTYEMKNGHIFTIGANTNQKNNLLLLTNVQSQYCSHAFSFGDESQKKLLTTDIDDIMKQKLPEIRKLSKVDINFLVSTQTQEFQSQDVMEQLKILTLMHEIAVLKIGNTHEPKHQTPQHIGDGFIKHCYDEKRGEDIVKLQMQMQVLKTQDWIESVQIINLENPDDIYDEVKGLRVQTVNQQFKTINQLMKSIQNKNLDLVVQFDSATVKKDGKTLVIKPKLNIVSIVIKGDLTQQNNKIFGLNLQKWNI